jgi:Protein of unknown function (DUF3800)
VTELKPSDLCLLVYIDETGHELFADQKYPMFGIGGCAILSQTCHRLIDQPWRRLKEEVFGMQDKPLHASQILRTATAEQRRNLLRFFSNGLFSRFAAVIRSDSSIPLSTVPYQIVAGVVYRAISKIAYPYPLDSLALIFEDSERGNRLAHQYFGPMKCELEGKEIPVKKHRMAKGTLEPGLEVADFVVNTAGRHIRHAMKTGRREPNDLFRATFANVSSLLTAYSEITGAEHNLPADNSVTQQ